MPDSIDIPKTDVPPEWLTYTLSYGWLHHSDEESARREFNKALAEAQAGPGIPEFADTLGVWRADAITTVRVVDENGDPAPEGYPLASAKLVTVDHLDVRGHVDRMFELFSEFERQAEDRRMRSLDECRREYAAWDARRDSAHAPPWLKDAVSILCHVASWTPEASSFLRYSPVQVGGVDWSVMVHRAINAESTEDVYREAINAASTNATNLRAELEAVKVERDALRARIKEDGLLVFEAINSRSSQDSVMLYEFLDGYVLKVKSRSVSTEMIITEPWTHAVRQLIGALRPGMYSVRGALAGSSVCTSWKTRSRTGVALEVTELIGERSSARRQTPC